MSKGEETLEPSEETEVDPIETSGADFEASAPSMSPHDVDVSHHDTPDTPLRFTEKKRLHWSGKTCKWFRPLNGLGNVQILSRATGTDLAPLTTVGNLVSSKAYLELCKGGFHIGHVHLQPFRRLCVSLGAEITCGESERLNMITMPEP